MPYKHTPFPFPSHMHTHTHTHLHTEIEVKSKVEVIISEELDVLTRQVLDIVVLYVGSVLEK